jgi:hypothetical protein
MRYHCAIAFFDSLRVIVRGETLLSLGLASNEEKIVTRSTDQRRTRNSREANRRMGWQLGSSNKEDNS